jgi:O-antigen/teichoic acid export membrane protein
MLRRPADRRQAHGSDATAPVATGLGRGGLYGVLGVGLEKLVALGVALYLPRHLGLADYGRYAFLISYLGFFQVLPDAGLEVVLVARLARGGVAAAWETAGRGALVRLAVSLTGGGLALVVLALVMHEPGLVAAGVVGVVGLAASAATPYRVLLRAQLRMGRYLALLGLQAVLAIVLLAAVVRNGGGLAAVLAAVSTAALAGLVVGRVLVGPGVHVRWDAGLARLLFAEAWPLAGTTLALLGAQQVVQLVLLRLHGAAEVGLLGGAQKLVEAINLLPQALMLSVLPALSLATVAPGGAARTAREAARVLVIAILPAVIAFGLWADDLLALVLGPPFVEATPVLRLLAPAALLAATGVVLTNLMVALGLQRILLRVTAAAAMVLVVVGCVLVPGAGAVGAAVAVVVSMLCGQILLLSLRATRVPTLTVLGAVVPPLGLGALIAGGLVATHTSLPLGLGVLAIVYPVLLLATRTVTRADLARWIG